jgi:transposase
MSIQAISELTGWDRKTIRKYMHTAGLAPEYGPRSAPPSKLDAFKPYLEERLGAEVWNARLLLRELRERNYAGGYTILTDWLRPQRSAARVVAVQRFETAPGKQAQVDWGHWGTLEMGEQEQKLHGFTFTLGYSRRMVANLCRISIVNFSHQQPSSASPEPIFSSIAGTFDRYSISG